MTTTSPAPPTCTKCGTEITAREISDAHAIQDRLGLARKVPKVCAVCVLDWIMFGEEEDEQSN